MTSYHEALTQLRYQLSRKAHLETALENLYTQKRERAQQLAELETCKNRESADVSRLEKPGLASLFYSVSGKLEQKLETERAEAAAAVLRYQAAQRELEALDQDIAQYEAELASLADCQSQYDKLLLEKAAYIKASGSPDAQELLRLEEQIAGLDSQLRELSEAVLAGTEARHTADEIMSCLNSAEGWGTWDLIGGGLLTDLAKHSRLDEAQELVYTLQHQLSRFRAELADVELCADISISIDGFLRFADYFLDGLFSSLSVLERIHDAQAQVSRTSSKLAELVSHLHHLYSSAEQERATCQARHSEIILRAAL